MSDVKKMQSFGQTPQFYDIIDVLADMAYTIATSEYANRLVFRGGFTLLAALIEKNLLEYPRLTTDLDIDWKDAEMWGEFLDTLPEFLSLNSKHGWIYTLKSRRDYESGESIRLLLQCELSGEQTYEVGIDMSLRETLDIVSLKAPRMDFYIKSGGVYEMICDKLYVFSTEHLGRRVKDMYDLYIISYIPNIQKDKILSLWGKLGYQIEDTIFGMTPSNFSRIKKPWDRLKNEIFASVPFETAMERVLNFVTDLYQEFVGGRSDGNNWHIEKGMWL